MGWVIKNRGRHAHSFPGGAAGNEARPAPHPIEETTNVPRPGSGAPRVSHQSDPGPLAQGCVPIAGALVQSSQTSDENDRTARVGAISHPKRDHESNRLDAFMAYPLERSEKTDSFCGIRLSGGRCLGSSPLRQGVNIRKFPATSPAVTITAAICSSCSISIPASSTAWDSARSAVSGKGQIPASL